MANLLASPFVCVLALGVSAVAAQERARNCTEVLLDMQSFELDSKTNLINLRAPRITQCEMTIVADQAVATSTDVQAKSEWRFNGHVKITLASGVLTSDTAVFTFDEKQLARGELTGQATFEDPNAGDKDPARGGANKIIYDYAARTLRLTENAWFHRDQYQASGCDLVYNLSTEHLTSGSTTCADRFQIRVLPKQGEPAAGADAPR
jgi:lipopolysaccharide transport protein LptA